MSFPSGTSDPGAKTTPIADPERRRSARLASREKHEDTKNNQARDSRSQREDSSATTMDNTKDNSASEPGRPTIKPKVVLNVNTQQSLDLNQGSSKSRAHNNKIMNKSESTTEKSPNARRVQESNSSRRVSASTATLEETGISFNHRPSSRADHTDHSTGRGNRSGPGEPSMTGPSQSSKGKGSSRRNILHKEPEAS